MNTRKIALALSTIFILFFISSTQVLKADDFTNSLGMTFVYIEPGVFTMGKDALADSDEGPSHLVAITKGFYLSAYEVTQEQWLSIMEDNPSQFQNPKSPVETVSWDDAQEFIKRLNLKEGTDIYSLPTEAQWEYAARAATSTDYFFGDDPAKLPDYAWFFDNSGGSTQSVGQKLANPFSLFDIYGNVFEWVADLYVKDYYSVSPEADPRGPESSMDQYRVIRGGAFDSAPFLTRSSFRSYYGGDSALQKIGFRVAATR
ncbi:MAG: formylglycine-generating enzyme family protein [Deltaproteobacteria bacterium]|jgi:formylglycine-generating enzyme required for sulfatase activity|nr:formylglycine-generating enzyme family protein [Deltaproteobacteria bacterium]